MALEFTDSLLGARSFVLLLDALSEEKLQTGSLIPIITQIAILQALSELKKQEP